MISSVTEFIRFVSDDAKRWGFPGNKSPWFRGQSSENHYLLPSVFRPLFSDIKIKKIFDDQNEDEFLKFEREIESSIKEKDLTEIFFKKASSLGQRLSNSQIDEALFIMQHVGLPTRLLDWTESSLTALYFAINKSYIEGKTKENPVVWMLNPDELNKMSDEAEIEGIDKRIMMALKPVPRPPRLPRAIQPKYVHTRMSVQKSCFTVHGEDVRHFEWIFRDTLIKNRQLIKYTIDRNNTKSMLDELRLLGITHSTLFPDLDGLAKELKMLYGYR